MSLKTSIIFFNCQIAFGLRCLESTRKHRVKIWFSFLNLIRGALCWASVGFLGLLESCADCELAKSLYEGQSTEFSVGLKITPLCYIFWMCLFLMWIEYFEFSTLIIYWAFIRQLCILLSCRELKLLEYQSAQYPKYIYICLKCKIKSLFNKDSNVELFIFLVTMMYVFGKSPSLLKPFLRCLVAPALMQTPNRIYINFLLSPSCLSLELP